MSICKRFSWVVAFIAFTSTAWGQVANSPYSQFGIGETYSNALANTQGSAGLGVSLPQFWFINNQNPALLVYNSFASFQGGVLGESKTIRDNSISEKFKGGNMNYLVTAFPVKHNKKNNTWGASLGLMPYSSMNYKIFEGNNQVEGLPNSNIPKYLEGNGGITQLYWSNGVRVYRDFSIGLKAAYLFGSIDRATKLYQSTVQVNEDKSYVKDFKFDLGFSYSKDSIGSNNLRVSVGSVYSLAKNVRTFLSNKTSQLDSRGDTLFSTLSQKMSGYTHLPSSINFGAALSKDGKWAIGAEYFYQDWSSFTTLSFTQSQAATGENLGKWTRASFGGEFTPDANAVEGFFNKVTYRVGFTAEQYPYYPEGKRVKDYGVNFGFSVPTGRSSIDLGCKVGKRGNKSENPIEESYFKVYFGVTFNDVWFIRRKFD